MPVGVGVVSEMGTRTAGTGVADRRAVGVGHDSGGGSGSQNITGIFPLAAVFWASVRLPALPKPALEP